MGQESGRSLGRFGFAWCAVLIAAGCGGGKSKPPEQSVAAPLAAASGSPVARSVLAGLRARAAATLPIGLAEGFDPVTDGLRPRFADARASARVRLPDLSLSAVRLEDARSDAAVDIALDGALIVEAEAAEGYVVYPKAHVSGATLLHRALPDGVEDFLSFDEAPANASISYKVSLRNGVAGLRLIAGALEMLDASGTPRLRVAPPYVVGADGERADAVLAVEGCHFDSSGAPPWGRKVTPPGAKSCTVRVSWNDDDVAYPAILDPKWTTTATSMVASRTDHTATLLSDGRVLVTGGRTSNTSTTGVSTAEVFSPAGGGTWAATNSMTGARYMHSATLLPTSGNTSLSGRVLIAGGVTGTASVNTTQLWNPANGQWANGPNLNAARHGHTATLLVSSGTNNGNVLVTGGMSLASGTTTVLNTAAIFTNPTTGTTTGSWAATGNMGTARRFHTATMLTTNSPNNTNFVNMVLVAGGNTGGTTSTTSAQLFNPTNATWTNTTALGAALESHTATRLANGNVLITGGRTNNGSPINTTAVFTIPTTGTSATWPANGNMQAARIGHTATLLGTTLASTGSVLIAGGSTTGTAAINTAELWNGTAFSLVATNLPSAVQAHTATLLANGTAATNGTVLIAGGNSGTNAVNTARLFDPSLGVACTSNGQCQSGFCQQGVCCATACTNQCQSCNLTGSVGTCTTRPANSTCNDGNNCTSGDTCSGTTCAGTQIICPGADACHTVLACNQNSGCPQPIQFADGTACNDNNPNTEIDACAAGVCVGTANPANVTSFDLLGRWSIGAGGTGTIVGLNSNHTQGTKSLEVTAQNFVPFNSVRMGSLSGVGPIVLLDIMLPTQQANPFWFGQVQMYVNAPSVGINNAFLGAAELTGLPLATWQTVAFQLNSDQVTRLSGSYNDLTFEIALNVPYNETGHYLFDNLRFSQDIIPTLQGIAKDSANVEKAIFTYTTTATSTSLPYGPMNNLFDQNGIIHTPLELPPQVFVSAPHAAFVATMLGSQLGWRVATHSVTATLSSTQLPTETGTDGGKNAILPDGTRVPLDTVSPAVADAFLPTDSSYTAADQARDAQLTNPIGPTSAGTLPGNFKVTDDGAAEYVVPLDTPAGRNGVEPHLALVYNSRSNKSQKGDGFLGPGWTLRGLHRITRCKTTFGYADERGKSPAPIMFDNTDQFCFDDEPLVQVSTNEYRTKRDIGAKFVVTASDSLGPVTFQVFRHDGMIETYGVGAGSDTNFRVTAVNGTVPSNSALAVSTVDVRKEWLLTTVADRFGNTMTFTYRLGVVVGASPLLHFIGGTTAEAAPDTITYTSNSATGRSATKTVRFRYTGFLSPFVVKLESGASTGTSSETLTSIEISAPDPVKPAIVTTYKLTYEAPSITNRQLLTRVQRCGRDGFCMQPTQFTWEKGSYHFRHVLSNVDDAIRPDLAYDTDTFIRSTRSRFLVAADVNGDGRDDLIYRTFIQDITITGIRQQSRIKVRLGGPDGFGDPIDTGIPAVLTDMGNDQMAGNFYHKPVPFDINGDGRADLSLGNMFTDIPGHRRYDLFFGNGDGTFSADPPGLTDDQRWDPALNPEAVQPSLISFFLPGDYDGDGRFDIARSLGEISFGFRRNVGGVLVPNYITPTFGTLSPGGPIPMGGTQLDILTADLDGDGRTEVVMGGDAHYAVHDDPHSDNDAFNINLTGIAPNDTGPFFTGRRVDLNGDGLPDILVTQGSTTTTQPPKAGRIWFNLGRTSANTNLLLPTADLDVSNTASNDFDIEGGIVTDLNDDGLDDFFVPAGCNTLVTKAYISKGDGTFTRVDLPDISNNGYAALIGAAQFCPHVMMDIDGDGQMDFVQPENASQNAGHLQIYFRDSKKPDRITNIVNGIGASTTIEYGRAGLDSGPPITCQYPKACAGRQVDVVSGYTLSEGNVPAGQTGTTHYTMTYGGSTADLMGAGWLGFTTVDRKNDRTKVEDRKQYDLTTRIGNWYPFVGVPTIITTQFDLAATGRRITHRRQTTLTAIQSNIADQFGPYLIRPLKIDDREVEQAPGEGFDIANAQRWNEQNFTYDGFGNVKTHETLGKKTNTREFIEYSVTNDTAQWLMDKVDLMTTTSTAANGDQDQRVTLFAVDSATGALNSKTVQPNDPVLQLVTAFTRNPDGLVSVITETPVTGDFRTRRIDYDPVEGALPIADTNALGQTTRYAYHIGLGLLVTSTDPNGVTTRSQFDGFGRVRARFEAEGLITHIDFFRNGNNLGMFLPWSDSSTRSGQSIADELGREVTRTETAFDGTHQRRIDRIFDPVSGKPQFVTRPFNATALNTSSTTGWTFTYDEMGRVTSETPPGEALRTTIYDRLKTTHQVSLGDKRYHVQDGLGRVVLAADIEPNSPSPNHEIQTGYDYGPFGNLRHVFQPGGSTLDISYDHLGHRTQVIDPDAGTHTTIYNAFGEVDREQLAGQGDVVYSRDLLGRVQTVTSDDGMGSYQWDTAANGIGKMDTETSAFGVTSRFAYQTNGQIATTTWNVANTDFAFDWGYEPTGRLQTITYPGIGSAPRFAVGLTYGGDGQIGSVSPAAGGTPYWAKTDVADDGQLQGESFSDGLLGRTDTDPVTGRVTHIATGTGSFVPDPFGGQTFQNALQSLSYGYYDDGKLQIRRDLNLESIENFSYENSDRLSTWSVNTLGSFVVYGYDDTGNLTSRRETNPIVGVSLENYGYGGNGAGPHALTSTAFGTYGYDPSGRQTSRPGQPLLTYTSFDLPKQIQSATNGSTTFTYGADGQRVRKVTSTSDVITLERLYERRVQGGVTTHVFYLPGDGKSVGQVRCDASGTCEAPIFFHQDMLGTVDTLTSNGAVIGREKRDPFGRIYNPGSFTDPSPTVALGFIGESEDRDEGLVNLNHRLYDAKIGRFISPDPLIKSYLDGQAFNRYSYAANNPLSFRDPTGLQAEGSDDGDSESDPGETTGADVLAGGTSGSDSGFAAATPVSAPASGGEAPAAQQVDPEDPHPIGGAGPGYVAVTYHEGAYHGEDRWGNWSVMPSMPDPSAPPSPPDLAGAPPPAGTTGHRLSAELQINIMPGRSSFDVGPFGGRRPSTGDTPSRRATSQTSTPRTVAISDITVPPMKLDDPAGKSYTPGITGTLSPFKITGGSFIFTNVPHVPKSIGPGYLNGKVGVYYDGKFYSLQQVLNNLASKVNTPSHGNPMPPTSVTPIAPPNFQLTLPDMGARGSPESHAGFGLGQLNLQPVESSDSK